jgi:hypothetical protein
MQPSPPQQREQQQQQEEEEEEPESEESDLGREFVDLSGWPITMQGWAGCSRYIVLSTIVIVSFLPLDAVGRLNITSL